MSVKKPAEHQLDAQDVRIFCGQSHPVLAQSIADDLGVPLEKTHFRRFGNDCLEVQLGASVRSRTVYIVQTVSKPVDQHLMELLVMLDIARSAGAVNIHAIIPYFAYARSDKKDAPRISITARLVADLLKTAGATHIMTMTLHSPQVHGFFSVPTDVLTARKDIARYFQNNDKYNLSQTVVVSPDVGHAKSATRFAEMLNLPVLAASKERISDTEVKVGGLPDEAVRKYQRALVYDDEISTGGSILAVSQELVRLGIKEIIPICTHGAFSSETFNRLGQLPEIVEIVATDTLPMPKNPPPHLTIRPVAHIFGEAIWRNATRQSIGELFTGWKELDDI